jgi:hypothetical protein
MFASIRYKLLVSYLLLVPLVTRATASLAAYVLSTFHTFYLSRVRDDLYGRADAVMDQVRVALEMSDPDREARPVTTAAARLPSLARAAGDA